MKPRLVVAAGLLLAVAAGCNLFTAADVAGDLVNNATPTCETVPCGTTSMQVCTSTSVEGTCSGISYEVGSKTFSCASCTDCEEAATQASELCEGSPGTGPYPYPTYDASPGPSPTVDSGPSSPLGMASCSAAVPCGTSGATYEECVTTLSSGGCEAIAMTTSTGQTFACAGCDCTQAAQELASYCEETSADGGVDAN
jgi:hypothetical protein